ncbi:hypothetical protein Btru_060912 [Bulinus truncatus]|nr:hypothetical protein Btru_060912 [Bulinus truncatus]
MMGQLQRIKCLFLVGQRNIRQSDGMNEVMNEGMNEGMKEDIKEDMNEDMNEDMKEDIKEDMNEGMNPFCPTKSIRCDLIRTGHVFSFSSHVLV